MKDPNGSTSSPRNPWWMAEIDWPRVAAADVEVLQRNGFAYRIGPQYRRGHRCGSWLR
ncbi:hypothetical protein LMG27177_06815 [Paraburkholderia fynbosensis]|uniref:Uncharacterized protein n=1 Tax=Paraburkholderia fynbosensis TaxID=1200993 RepID=A0A6J5H5V9_9BURK|nr:hypothetical protein LMG27177_06815 [Paraburkholderia fynbosensis]